MGGFDDYLASVSSVIAAVIAVIAYLKVHPRVILKRDQHRYMIRLSSLLVELLDQQNQIRWAIKHQESIDPYYFISARRNSSHVFDMLDRAMELNLASVFMEGSTTGVVRYTSFRSSLLQVANLSSDNTEASAYFRQHYSYGFSG